MNKVISQALLKKKNHISEAFSSYGIILLKQLYFQMQQQHVQFVSQ